MSGSMTPARTIPALDQLTFDDALKQALQGKRVRRLAWPEDGCSMFFSITPDAAPSNGGILRFRDGAGIVHDLTLQDGDVTATDWIVVREH